MTRQRWGIDTRQHKITFTDAQMVMVGKRWIKETTHTDSPTVADIEKFRLMLEREAGQDLKMICLFWLRNEVVAMRKKGLFKE